MTTQPTSCPNCDSTNLQWVAGRFETKAAWFCLDCKKRVSNFEPV